MEQEARHQHQPIYVPMMAQALVSETKLVAEKLGYVPRTDLATARGPVTLLQISLSRKEAASVGRSEKSH